MLRSGPTWLRTLSVMAMFAAGALSLLARTPPTVARLEFANSLTGPSGVASWTEAGTVVTTRIGAAVTPLADGSVLVTGGQTSAPGSVIYYDSVERYDPATNSWSSVASMKAKRVFHTATLLTDGRVLVAGGLQGAGADSETYNPATNVWTNAAAMISGARTGHTATLLSDGRVLAAGGTIHFGSFNPYSGTAETYNPATNRWSGAGTMSVVRGFHTSTLLPDGRVLVAGGFGGAPPSGTTTANADLYNPQSNSWSAAPPMATPRESAAAVALPGGDVLVIGGSPDETSSPPLLDSAEIYHPGNNSWTAAAHMSQSRRNHAATLLQDGRVIVVGGVMRSGRYFVALDWAELYDPALDTWTPLSSMLSPHGAPRNVRLSDGRVLVVSYDPAAATAAEVFTSPGLAPDQDGDGVPDVSDNCVLVPNPVQENTTRAIDHGSGLAGDDGTVPTSHSTGDACTTDADADGLNKARELSPTGCEPFDLSTTTHANPSRGDNTNDDNHDGNPESPMGTDLADSGPSSDTDNDGVLDGYECDHGSNPRDAASKPSVLGDDDADSDGDGLLNGWERRGWGTDANFGDTDGDGKGDCVEAVDVDGNGVANFPGDTIATAKAALGIIGKTQDFDLNKDGVVNFPGDAVNGAKRTTGTVACL